MHKTLVTTVPFGEIDPKPLESLQRHPGMETVVNPLGRRLKSAELTELLAGVTVLVAGTEPILRESLERASELQIICRVGIGLDNVDLIAARERGIRVAYTPDAPAPAVAELALGHMLNLCRYISLTDRGLKSGEWVRRMGVRLANSVIGVIGVGRIGSRVVRHLSGFSPSKILVDDIRELGEFCATHACEQASKQQIFETADIISLHVPLTELTHDLITVREFSCMKPNAILINTARGGIVNESDLFDALEARKIAAAAMDVFEQEPYAGPLTGLENCVLSCHMGSCTKDCRFAMELEAVEEALRFVRGEPLLNEVPEEEYRRRKAGVG